MALARQAGLSAASPIVVAAVACTAMAAWLTLGVNDLAHTLGNALAAACSGRSELTGLQPATLPATIGALTAPLIAVALAAGLAHFAQTRTLWLPRRRIAGGPTLLRGASWRARNAAFELAGAVAIGGTAVMWLWVEAPNIARLVEQNAPDMLRGTTALVAMFVSCLGIGWVALGVVDSLFRHAELSRALAMTAAEKREDDRLHAADPRWANQRTALSHNPSAEPAVRDAAVILLGDDRGVAIAWDPLRQPVPTRVAIGQGARSTQLVGLARRYGIAIHRDPLLVAAIGNSLGPVPEREWARLADIIAAVRR